MKNRIICIFLFLFTLVFTNAQDLVTGGSGPSALSAADEFRHGVHAFNRFAYNESILAFERALSFRPGEGLILDWLGRAYYRSGMEEIALRQWRAALDSFGRNSGAGMLLSSRIETVSNRRFLLPVANDGVRYVQSGRFPSRTDDIIFFRQPTSILANPDGSIWVVAYGSNELVRIDVNGIIRERRRGPLNGFDRPYDLVRGIDGRMYLSEFQGGRVSILSSRGEWLGYIGSRGIGEGQLFGPQNIAIDSDGYLYVVDYGNKRISKYDPDGAFINSFAQRTASFAGLLSPTGIAAGGSKIFVADGVEKAIYTFDTNGNFLGRLALDGLKAPESLRFVSDGLILAADANRVLLIETEAAIVRELGLIGNDRSHIRSAEVDSNGNVVAAFYETNRSGRVISGEVAVLTRSDDLASGFFVQIRNVNSNNFPNVVVDFTVEDRMRRPILGLDTHNFLLTEGGFNVMDQVFLDPGNRFTGADISFLVERSMVTANLQNDLVTAARDINRALGEMENGNVVSVISAGTQPRRESHENSLENALRGTANSFSASWRFDLGLRLAATDLLSASPRRSVVYIGSGSVGEMAFEQYSLSELSAYLANNGIVFNAIIIGQGQLNPGIEYLCNFTGGQYMHLFRPRGIGELIKSVGEMPSGLYSFSFNSSLPTDFGRAWLPLEIEVYLMERSGRDNVGYFPPLE